MQILFPIATTDSVLKLCHNWVLLLHDWLEIVLKCDPIPFSQSHCLTLGKHKLTSGKAHHSDWKNCRLITMIVIQSHAASLWFALMELFVISAITNASRVRLMQRTLLLPCGMTINTV